MNNLILSSILFLSVFIIFWTISTINTINGGNYFYLLLVLFIFPFVYFLDKYKNKDENNKNKILSICKSILILGLIAIGTCILFGIISIITDSGSGVNFIGAMLVIAAIIAVIFIFLIMIIILPIYFLTKNNKSLNLLILIIPFLLLIFNIIVNLIGFRF